MTCTAILTEEKIEKIAQSIIDEYDLDHNNAEINVNDGGIRIRDLGTRRRWVSKEKEL